MRLLLTLAIGGAGGALFFWLRMPLPWLMGAMVATTVAALAGAPLHAPQRLRSLMVPVLGLTLGGAFTPESLHHAAGWLPSIALLITLALLITALLTALLTRWAHFDPATAYFSSVPGGLTEMILTGGALGGDERTISLMHATRILVAVTLIPLWFRWSGRIEPGATLQLGTTEWPGAGDALLLLGCAVAGWRIGQLLRMPAPLLLGPLLASIALHLLLPTAPIPPAPLVALAQVALGASIGCRFAGTSLREIGGRLLIGGATTLLMLSLVTLAANLLASPMGVPAALLVLALSPGGVAEMGLISLALGADAAFVTTHHAIRILIIVLAAPPLFRLIRNRLAGAARES